MANAEIDQPWGTTVQATAEVDRRPFGAVTLTIEPTCAGRVRVLLSLAEARAVREELDSAIAEAVRLEGAP